MQRATDITDAGPATLDGVGEIGECSVLVGELDELVDLAGELAVLGVFGLVDEHADHDRQQPADARVGADAFDLECVVDRDVSGEQRITHHRMIRQESGELAIAGGRRRGDTEGGSEIAGHRPVLVAVAAPVLGDGNQGGAFGGELTGGQFVGSQTLIELGIGRPDTLLDQLAGHDTRVSNWCSIRNLKSYPDQEFCGRFPCFSRRQQRAAGRREPSLRKGPTTSTPSAAGWA